jgi:dTDP-4-dehydrorhamnose 3,5-epimerase
MDTNSFIQSTNLSEVFEIQRPTISDDRGFFREPVRIKGLEEKLGHPFHVAQMNHARSSQGALRGIHIAPWNKLIYVVRGKVQAVICDLRENSQNFGKYQSFIIGDENKSSIFVPKGCGNSYLVLSDEADYVYLTDQEWAPNLEKGVIWNDSDLKVKWELDENELVLSEKDKQNPSLRDLFPNKF